MWAQITVNPSWGQTKLLVLGGFFKEKEEPPKTHNALDVLMAGVCQYLWAIVSLLGWPWSVCSVTPPGKRAAPGASPEPISLTHGAAVFSMLHSLSQHHSQICAGHTTDRLCNGFESSFFLAFIWINPDFVGLSLVFVNLCWWQELHFLG